MRRRRLGLIVLLLCLGPDFASPMVPGAFCFDPETSVDGMRAPRARTPVVAVASVAPTARLPEVAAIQPLLRRSPTAAPIAAALLPSRGAYPPAAADPGAAADDH